MCPGIMILQAGGMLSEIYPGESPKSGSGYWNQIQEKTVIFVIKRVLQRLHDLLEQVSFTCLRFTKVFEG